MTSKGAQQNVGIFVWFLFFLIYFFFFSLSFRKQFVILKIWNFFFIFFSKIFSSLLSSQQICGRKHSDTKRHPKTTHLLLIHLTDKNQHSCAEDISWSKTFTLHVPSLYGFHFLRSRLDCFKHKNPGLSLKKKTWQKI
jgi:hypothetical protein